jgi:hypothetical protein
MSVRNKFILALSDLKMEWLFTKVLVKRMENAQLFLCEPRTLVFTFIDRLINDPALKQEIGLMACQQDLFLLHRFNSSMANATQQ